MDTQLPITLSGPNLRDRHRNLNSLVNQSYKKNISFEDVAELPETSAVDRIFKLELASKLRNVEYIVKNLKDDDMLYVSRSLKCLWLLEPQYCDIINPLYLENTLYPEMIQPAVNKMKHWIQVHLKDADRCQQFYDYYKDNFNDAFNYYWHCSSQFIMSEFPNVIAKLSPKQVKIIFEVCPSACKSYFDILPNNRAALTKYGNDSQNYFNSIKSILKRDTNLFLDIIEKYFNSRRFLPYGPSVTRYIMKYYRNRFDAKCELYTSSFLHMKTLANNLTSDQAKELILRLARAEYLASWFSYKKVEPLIKRLRAEDRPSLKKQVFVDKTIEPKVKEWPYPIPEPLLLKVEDQARFFTEHEPYEYGNCKVMKRISRKCLIAKSPLDLLFNRYRFIGFQQTFHELSKNLLAESTIEGRLNMMLVLVSKSGGVTVQVDKLLKLLLERHRNETTTLRAAVVRSLVKRACVWRLPENVWQSLLEFGKDIGLDGAETDPLCREGLHAVVLHNLLAETTTPPGLLAGFLRHFTTFKEYTLSPEEKKIVAKRLPSFVLPLDANAFLDTVIQYKINIEDVAEAKQTLLERSKTDSALVTRLFKVKLLRRELFNETFAIRQNSAAYINALRHDTSVLEKGKKFADFVARERPNHDRFLKSLFIYFGEAGGLAEQHRMALEEVFLTNPSVSFGRPLCCLASNDIMLNLLAQYESERPQSKWQLLMSSTLRANAHKTKPPLDVNALEWRRLGAKAVANRVFVCRKSDRQRYIKRLLEWRRTARISVRISSSAETFSVFANLRPLAALKIALSIYLSKDYIEPFIWNVLKSIIQNKDMTKNQRLLVKLLNHRHISKNVLVDYWVLVYNIFKQIDEKKTTPILCRLETMLPDVDANFVRGVVEQFIDIKFNPDLFSKEKDDYHFNKVNCLYVRIIAKHLLLCKSEHMQEEVIDNVCEPFFNAIEILFQTLESNKTLIKMLDDFVYSLKYSKVFLSKQFVSPLPVFERILSRMRKILLVEEHFEKYVVIHLTMLYYKTIKQADKLKPGIFDELKRQDEAIEIVGRIFGQYISHEIKELVTKYFKSIVDLYKVTLKRFFDNHFRYGDSRYLLVAFTVKCLLEAETTEASILAEYIFQKEQHNIPEPQRVEILDALEKYGEEEVKFFLYADVIPVK